MKSPIYYVIIGLLYALSSITLFIIIQLLAFFLPIIIVVAVLLMLGTGESEPSYFHLIIIGGGSVGSIFNCIYLVGTLKYMFIEPEFGEELDYEPLLIIVNGICVKLGIELFDKVFIVPNTVVATTETFRGKYLILGLIPLHFLTRMEMEGMIAHECAHYDNNAMFHVKVQNMLNLAFDGYSRSMNLLFKKVNKLSDRSLPWLGSGMLIATSPLLMISSVFKKYLVFTSLLFSDLSREYYCDRVGAMFVGSTVFSQALLNMHLLCIIQSTMSINKKRGDNLDKYRNEYNRLKLEPFEASNIINHRMVSKTHPMIFNRLEYIRGLGYSSLADDSKPIIGKELFSDLWYEFSQVYKEDALVEKDSSKQTLDGAPFKFRRKTTSKFADNFHFGFIILIGLITIVSLIFDSELHTTVLYLTLSIILVFQYIFKKRKLIIIDEDKVAYRGVMKKIEIAWDRINYVGLLDGRKFSNFDKIIIVSEKPIKRQFNLFFDNGPYELKKGYISMPFNKEAWILLKKYGVARNDLEFDIRV